MPAIAIRAAPPRARRLLGRLDDERLAQLAADGDERAFAALYDRHHGALLGFCRHMVGSREEAEDALQQCFLRAHRALRARGAPVQLRPWLFSIARNRCRTILAARRVEDRYADPLEPSTDGLADAVEHRADLRALLADVGRLPDEQRAALVLAELADLPHAEIGAVIGVPAPKVKALIHQARSTLIAEREARETPCASIREQLATARGGMLRRGPLRRHLRGCVPCRSYAAAIAEQRRALALVLPVVPSIGLKASALGLATGAGAGGAATGTGIAAGGLAAKLAVGAVLAATAVGGVALVRAPDAPRKRAAAAPAASATRSDAASSGHAAATTPGAGGATTPALHPAETRKAHRARRAAKRAAARARRRSHARRVHAARTRATKVHNRHPQHVTRSRRAVPSLKPVTPKAPSRPVIAPGRLKPAKVKGPSGKAKN